MSGFLASRWNVRPFGDGSMIKGVCATIAGRAAVPVWMPRAAFLVFGVLHWFFAIVLYVVLVKVMRPARFLAANRRVPDWPEPQAGGVRDRFGALDARLAELEAATWQQETALRRQFQDLERH